MKSKTIAFPVIFFLSSLCAQVQAQTYHPFLNNSEWYEAVLNFGSTNFFWYYQDGDSVINNVTYSKIKQSYAASTSLVREDTVARTVYIIFDGTEWLLYDFNAIAGGSFYIVPAWTGEPPRLADVEQVTLVNTPAGQRKSFRLCIDCVLVGTMLMGTRIMVVEGVGSLTDPIALYNPVSDPSYYLVCSYQNQQQTFFGNSGFICPQRNTGGCNTQAVITGTTRLCNGDCTGQLSVVTNPPNNIVQYYWNGGTMQAVRTNLCAGYYSVTVIDGDGCMSAASREILTRCPGPVIQFPPIQLPGQH